MPCHTAIFHFARRCQPARRCPAIVLLRAAFALVVTLPFRRHATVSEVVMLPVYVNIWRCVVAVVRRRSVAGKRVRVVCGVRRWCAAAQKGA